MFLCLRSYGSVINFPERAYAVTEAEPQEVRGAGRVDAVAQQVIAEQSSKCICFKTPESRKDALQSAGGCAILSSVVTFVAGAATPYWCLMPTSCGVIGGVVCASRCFCPENPNHY